MSAGRGARPGGRGGGTHRQLSAERGLPMARGPERGEPGGITPARGRTSRERRREDGPRAGAQRRCRRGSAGPGEGRADRAESLCAASGAGGRWLLRSPSRRRVTGRQGG